MLSLKKGDLLYAKKTANARCHHLSAFRLSIDFDRRRSAALQSGWLEEVAEAVALLRQADDVIRGRESWEKLAAARAQAQKKEWSALLDRYPVKLPKEDGSWQGGGAGLDFDPRPLWEKTAIPALAVFGDADKTTPTEESARRVKLALSSGGNKDHTIKIFPNADHGLWVSPGKDAKWDWDRPAPGWLDLMVNWLQKHIK